MRTMFPKARLISFKITEEEYSILKRAMKINGTKYRNRVAKAILLQYLNYFDRKYK